MINNGAGLFSQAQLYGILVKRESLEKEVNGSTSKFITIRDMNEKMSHKRYLYKKNTISLEKKEKESYIYFKT